MQAALRDLPDQYAGRIENVDFAVARAPDRRQRQRLKLRGGLYGLYEGVPLTRRDTGYDRAFPDQITLFWGLLVRDFPDDGRLEDQVRKTVYHEIGHYFGLEEEELHGSSVE